MFVKRDQEGPKSTHKIERIKVVTFYELHSNTEIETIVNQKRHSRAIFSAKAFLKINALVLTDTTGQAGMITP